MTEANLIEIFSSIQGEGPYLGCQQIFVRFARCNLDCAYCDTPFKPAARCRVEKSPGSETFEEIPNPVAGETLVALIKRWKGKHPDLYHSISLTGGEPLLHSAVLSDWLPSLREYLPIYLETNGTLPNELSAIISRVDFISMDIKLPTLAKQGELWSSHRQFLKVAKQKEVFVKVVFDQNCPDAELLQAAGLVAEVDPAIPFILQPRTGPQGISLTTREIQKAQQLIAPVLPNVRVIPQTHTFLGVL